MLSYISKLLNYLSLTYQEEMTELPTFNLVFPHSIIISINADHGTDSNVTILWHFFTLTRRESL